MIRVMEADIELLYLAMRASAINECMNAKGRNTYSTWVGQKWSNKECFPNYVFSFLPSV